MIAVLSTQDHLDPLYASIDEAITPSDVFLHYDSATSEGSEGVSAKSQFSEEEDQPAGGSDSPEHTYLDLLGLDLAGEINKTPDMVADAAPTNEFKLQTMDTGSESSQGDREEASTVRKTDDEMESRRSRRKVCVCW